MNPCKQFLEVTAKLGAPDSGLETYAGAFLALAREGIVEEFTPEEQALIGRVKRRIHPEKRECFANAQRALLRYDQFRYFEGYATPKAIPIPIRHAWLELNGKLLDLTGDLANYYGIEIDRKVVAEYLDERKSHGPLLDDWELGFKYTQRLLFGNDVRTGLNP